MIEIRDSKEFETFFSTKQITGLGSHFLADFYEVKSMPQAAAELESLMVRAAKRIGATIVNSSFHEFSPQGLSGVVVIAESHFAAHTWPEHGVVCVDLFTCSGDMDPGPGLKMLFEELQSGLVKITKRDRGIQIGVNASGGGST